MVGWLQFEECGRRFRVSGLEGLESDLRKASGEMQQLIYDRVQASRAALERFYGRPAHHFAERVNAMLAAMMDLEGAFSEAATRVRWFPEDRLRLAHVVEAGRARRYHPPRVEPPAGPAGRIGADMDALRRWVDAAQDYDDRIGWLPRAADPDDVVAMEARKPSGLFGFVEEAVAAIAPTIDDPTDWERISPASLLPLPDLRPLAQAVRSHSMEAAQIAIATAEAYERADAELVAMLGRHPDLAGYVSAALGPRKMGGAAALSVVAAHFSKLDDLVPGPMSRQATTKALARMAGDPSLPEYVRDAARRLKDSPARLKMVAGRDGIVTRRDVLRHLADMRAYATAWEHLAVFDTAAKGDKPDGYISRADLVAASRNRKLSAEVRKAAALLLRRVDARPGVARGADTGIRSDDIVRHLVDGQAFADDPDAARRFVESLPVADNGKKGLPVGLCSADGVQALANAALESAAGSLTAQQSVIAHLPETDEGTRNELITAFYFAEHFHEGDAEIRKGFLAYVAARAEEDPTRRQALTFEGNVSIATHEQAGVQPYLEHVGKGVPDKIEVRYIDIRVGRFPIEVDRTIELSPGPSNLVAPLEILDLDPSQRSIADYSTPGARFSTDPGQPGQGVVHLDAISGVRLRFGYDYQTHRSTKSCQHLPEDDRWYAERSSLVNPGELQQATMVEATVAYLEPQSFTVSRWKTRATDAPLHFGFIGHRGQTAIEVDISEDGRTDVAVRMGPCATPTLDGFTEPLYERVPDQ